MHAGPYDPNSYKEARPRPGFFFYLVTMATIMALVIVSGLLVGSFIVSKTLKMRRMQRAIDRNTSDHTTETWDNTVLRCAHDKLLSQNLNPPCQWPVDHDGIPKPDYIELWSIKHPDGSVRWVGPQ